MLHLLRSVLCFRGSVLYLESCVICRGVLERGLEDLLLYLAADAGLLRGLGVVFSLCLIVTADTLLAIVCCSV